MTIVINNFSIGAEEWVPESDLNYFAVDVTDRQAVDRMAREVERLLGPVDLLVNNAGAFSSIGPMWEVPPDDWWQCIEVNLLGPFLCSRAILPGMVARRRGRILATASGAGLRPWPYSSAYAISKCAVIRFCENLAAETKEHGISVFAIHPGGVKTEMTITQLTSEAARKWFPTFYENMKAGRAGGSSERAAYMVVYLASGKADGLSGCYISVRDDINKMVKRADEIQEKQLYTLRLHT